MGPEKLGDVLKRIDSIDPADLDRRAEEYEQTEAAARSQRCMTQILADLGALAGAMVSNYEVYAGTEQAAVFRQCVEIGHDMDAFVESGKSLIWMGHVGTGKDHMAAALLKRAAQCGHTARWREGRDLYDDIVREIHAEGPSTAMDELVYPRVLCLSDPVFEINWSPAKAHALNLLVRRRVNAGKSTWITCNVAQAKADEMFGKDVWDRLVHHAVVLTCKWTSYRRRALNT
jgi:DNA replication protein DnaC